MLAYIILYLYKFDLINIIEATIMRKKLQQFRRKIRDDQINSYKENIRESLIVSMARNEKVEEFNISIRSCIEAKDVRKLFEIVTAAERSILKDMERQTLFEIYRLLSVSMPNMRSSQAIRHLVEVLYPTLFAEGSLEGVHTAIFEQLHSLADTIITHPEQATNPISNIQLENYLATLCRFYSPQFHKFFKRSDQYIWKFIIPWGKKMTGNILYLRLLSNIMSNMPSGENQQRLPIDQGLILQLSGNLGSQDERLALWSLMTLNDVLQYWYFLSQDCMKQILPQYLSIFSIICSKLETPSKNTKFKKQHLLESLMSLEKMVNVIWKENYQNVGLGGLMIAFDTIRLFSFVNQIQHFPDRCILYALLDFMVRVIMDLESDDRVLSVISQQLQDTLILGLENRFSNYITVNSLHVIQRLVRYESCTYDPIVTLENFRKSGIQNTLQYLQFNSHQEVAAISASLLEREFKGQETQAIH